MSGRRPLGDGDPEEIGGYRLRCVLGRGGMGHVYLAEDSSGRRVAVKVPLADHDAARARFLREAEALRRIRGRSTAALLAVQERGAEPYLVLEYIDGRTLAQRLREDGPLSEDEAREFAVWLAGVLVEFHEAGVAHRDLTPANVMLSGDGPKVIDFGLSWLEGATVITRAGTPLGTPGYMAPEQAAGGGGVAADIYAWACTVTHAATGKPPFGHTQRAVHDRQPDLSGLPVSLLPAVEVALNADEAQRPNAHELGELLRGERSAEQWRVRGVAAGASDQAEAVGGWSGRLRGRRMWLITAVVVVVSGLVTGVMTEAYRGLMPTFHVGGATPRTSAGVTAAPATEVRRLEPWGLGGKLAEGVEVAKQLSGSCGGHSQLVAREDAYSCSDDGTTPLRLDPCYRDPISVSTDLLCVDNAAKNSYVRLKPSGALPDDTFLVPHPSYAQLELSDGRICNPVGGATYTVAGQRMNYSCGNGRLFGDPDKSAATWTIYYRESTKDESSSLRRVLIAVAYE